MRRCSAPQANSASPSILVNNAGGVFKSPLLDTSENGWDALLQVQPASRAAVHAAGGARCSWTRSNRAASINVTSIEGVRAAPGYAAYAAAKAGVINYTKTAALELATHKIRVNALAPDLTLTEGIMRGVTGRSAVRCRPHDSDVAGLGHVDEMAGAAVFLASDMSSYITGQTIHVDGGTQAPRAAGTTTRRPATTSWGPGSQCVQPSAA